MEPVVVGARAAAPPLPTPPGAMSHLGAPRHSSEVMRSPTTSSGGTTHAEGIRWHGAAHRRPRSTTILNEYAAQLRRLSQDKRGSDSEAGTSLNDSMLTMGHAPATRASSISRKCKALIRQAQASRSYGLAMAVLIFANAIMIGFEQTARIQGDDTQVFGTIENIFLSSFVIELLARFYAEGKACLQDNFVKFDCILVFMGILAEWILAPLLGSTDELGPLMVLRTLRLLRLARTLRVIAHFRELWMLVGGLLNSAKTMLYTLILLMCMLYTFSCIGIEMITFHPLAVGPSADDQFQSIVDEHFSSVPAAMLTLVQFISFDNVVLIYKPLIAKDLKLAFYFVTIIIIVGIALMNLVTAVIVNSALEQAAQDKDMQRATEEALRKKVLTETRRLFQRLDEDGSACLTRSEIQNMSTEDRETITKMTGIDEPLEIFDAIDIDDSGDISIEEFLNGIWQISISNTPLVMKKIEKQVDQLRRQMDQTTEFQEDMRRMMRSALHELNTRREDDRQATVAVREAATTSWYRQLLPFSESSPRDEHRKSYQQARLVPPAVKVCSVQRQQTFASEAAPAAEPHCRSASRGSCRSSTRGSSRRSSPRSNREPQGGQDRAAAELQRVCTEEVQHVAEEVRSSLLRLGQDLEQQIAAITRAHPRNGDYAHVGALFVTPGAPRAGDYLGGALPESPAYTFPGAQAESFWDPSIITPPPADNRLQIPNIAMLLPEDFGREALQQWFPTVQASPRCVPQGMSPSGSPTRSRSSSVDEGVIDI